MPIPPEVKVLSDCSSSGSLTTRFLSSTDISGMRRQRPLSFGRLPLAILRLERHLLQSGVRRYVLPYSGSLRRVQLSFGQSSEVLSTERAVRTGHQPLLSKER